MAKDTGIIPDALKNRPTLGKVWDYPYQVWGQISPGRLPVFEGIGRIPFSEFASWGNSQRYSPEDYTLIWPYVRAIDQIWVELVMEKKSQDTPKTGKTPPKKRK